MLWKWIYHTPRCMCVWEWGYSQRSLSGGRDTRAVVWRMSRTKPGGFGGGGEVQMRPWGRKESNTLEGQCESHCVWNTGAVGVSVVMTLGEFMQGSYRSCGRIFISILREWEKPLKHFKWGDPMCILEGTHIPRRMSWRGRNVHKERPFRRQECPQWPSGLAVGRCSGSTTCFRGKIQRDWPGGACKARWEVLAFSEPGTLEATAVGEEDHDTHEDPGLATPQL